MRDERRPVALVERGLTLRLDRVGISDRRGSLVQRVHGERLGQPEQKRTDAASCESGALDPPNARSGAGMPRSEPHRTTRQRAVAFRAAPAFCASRPRAHMCRYGAPDGGHPLTFGARVRCAFPGRRSAVMRAQNGVGRYAFEGDRPCSWSYASGTKSHSPMPCKSRNVAWASPAFVTR